MRHFIARYLLAAIVMICALAGNASAAHPKKLCFNNNHQFKIVQFSDLHLVWQDGRSDSAYQCIDQVVKAEKPDFIIVTGDIIYSQPAIDNFRKIMSTLSSYKTPFAFVFGNHDRQFNVTDSVLLNSVRDIPYNMTTTAPGVSGDCNFDLPLYSHDGKKIEAIIYGLDSHSESQFAKKNIKGYDYIHRDQIDWYAATSKKYTAQNGGTPLPAVMFFHIPLVEYDTALTTPRATFYGTRGEKVSCSNLNSGLFTALIECGDVMGVFCGHDHDSDYAVDYNGIMLAYGRFSGGNTEYNHLRGNGGRVIELTEGQRTIHTWIRLRHGAVQEETFFPKDYDF
jgi:3',5'-cyclic AMP phosphodiesterase CpdA